MGTTAINLFQLQKDTTITLLETNIGTTGVDSDTSQLISTKKEALTRGWLSDPENEMNPAYTGTDPNTIPIGQPGSNCPYLNPVYNAFYVLVLNPLSIVSQRAKTTPPANGDSPIHPNTDPTGPTLFGNFQTFLSTYLTAANVTNGSISNAFMLQITSTLGNSLVWPGPQNTTGTGIASGFLTTLTADKSMINSLSSQETQGLDTDSNIMQGILSTDGNAASSFTQNNDSVMSAWSETTSTILAGGI